MVLKVIAMGVVLWLAVPSLVVIVLAAVAVLSFCSRLRCTQILAGATLLFAASVLGVAPAKPDGILHCQDDIEAFHAKIFDRCGGEHGGFL